MDEPRTQILLHIHHFQSPIRMLIDLRGLHWALGQIHPSSRRSITGGLDNQSSHVMFSRSPTVLSVCSFLISPGECCKRRSWHRNMKWRLECSHIIDSFQVISYLFTSLVSAHLITLLLFLIFHSLFYIYRKQRFHFRVSHQVPKFTIPGVHQPSFGVLDRIRNTLLA